MDVNLPEPPDDRLVFDYNFPSPLKDSYPIERLAYKTGYTNGTYVGFVVGMIITILIVAGISLYKGF